MSLIAFFLFITGSGPGWGIAFSCHVSLASFNQEYFHSLSASCMALAFLIEYSSFWVCLIQKLSFKYPVLRNSSKRYEWRETAEADLPVSTRGSSCTWQFLIEAFTSVWKTPLSLSNRGAIQAQPYAPTHHQPPNWAMECNSSRACFQITSLWEPGHHVFGRYVLPSAQMPFRHVWACLVHGRAPPWLGPLGGSGGSTLGTFINIPMVGTAAVGWQGGRKYSWSSFMGKAHKNGAQNKWGRTWELPKTDWFVTYWGLSDAPGLFYMGAGIPVWADAGKSWWNLS